jgi:hopanoid biosynthesis associated protein HpnK
MKLSFVLPMYNEAENIGAMVAMIHDKASPLLEDYEIVIVNDASTDNCGEIADRLAQEDSRIRVVHHTHNRGLGAGIRSGFTASRMPYVLYSDSDLPVDFACLEWVLPKITPEVDILIGWRKGRAEGPRRAIMSWVYNRLIRTIFGLRVKDVNFAFKILRRDLLDLLHLNSEGSFIDAEILLEAHRVGCHLVEVGLDYHTRQAGVSSLSSPSVIIGILKEMGGYLACHKPSPQRQLIVNGDDFGLHTEVNQGIHYAYRHGILTSTSLLANGEAFDEAAAIARQEPGLETGVHLALTQLAPCLPTSHVSALLDGDGRFPDNPMPVLRKLSLGQIPEEQIEAEFRAQIERVRNAGLTISHLDGHQHVHVFPATAKIVAQLAKEYGIRAVRLPREPICWPRGLGTRALPRFLQSLALRFTCRKAAKIFRQAGLVFPDRFYGFANAGRMEKLIRRRLAHPQPGVTEIGCHPGRSTSELTVVFDWGYHWGEEMQALCEAKKSAKDPLVEKSSWRSCRPAPGFPLLTRWLTQGLAKTRGVKSIDSKG